MSEKNSHEFEGRIALVTGAGSGLGREVARLLAIEKAQVVAVSSSSTHLLTLDDELRKQEANLILAPLDLQNKEKIFALVGGIYERFGRLDILYGGAASLGTLSPIALSEQSLIERIFQTNLMANINLLRACHPLLLQSDAARGLWVSCDLGKDQPYWGYYHASKIALEAVIKAYAMEHPKKSMRMNILRAPAMHTKLYRQAFPGKKHQQSRSNQTDQQKKESPPQVISSPFTPVVRQILHSLSLQEHRHGTTIAF